MPFDLFEQLLRRSAFGVTLPGPGHLLMALTHLASHVRQSHHKCCDHMKQPVSHSVLCAWQLRSTAHAQLILHAQHRFTGGTQTLVA